MLRIKMLRVMKDLSQWELSKAAGINQATYSLLERALLEPSEDQRERLAQALHAPAATLFRQVCRTKTEAVSTVAAGVE